jgi:hypothetical protein
VVGFLIFTTSLFWGYAIFECPFLGIVPVLQAIRLARTGKRHPQMPIRTNKPPTKREFCAEMA